MALRFPEHILEEILNRIDIAELISGYIPLKKAGRNFKATCPFHHEKTPSFMVSTEKNIYHCFGCQSGGNAFSFLMKYEHLDFREAVETLAKKAGVTLPVIKVEDEKMNLAREIYRVNELAAEFYLKNLLSRKEAYIGRQYLAARKIKPETAKTFKLGFALDSWEDILNYLRLNKINLKVIERSGLVVAKEEGGYYDRFRNRVIFPIFDVKSRIIGFGARTIDESSDRAKYINSPETPVFIKGNNLYGLNFAKDAIREKDAAIVVEGYLDMITPFQEGVCNILASSGTALTENQIRLLKRYTKNITVIFDADSAGEIASLRSLDLFVEEGIYVKVAALPKGFDPDSIVREKGIDAFNAATSNSQDLFDYKLALLSKRFDRGKIEGKAKIAHEMLSTINKFKDHILKSQYLTKLAEVLNLNEQALLKEAEKASKEKNLDRLTGPINSLEDLEKPALERMLLTLMLKDTSLIPQVKKEIDLKDFQDNNIKQIVTTIFEHEDDANALEPRKLMNFFEDSSLSEIVSELSFNEDNYCIDGLDLGDRDKILNECLSRLKTRRLDSQRRTLSEQILAAQTRKDEEAVSQLIREYNSLVRNKI